MFSATRLQCGVLLIVVLCVVTSSFIVEVRAASSTWSIETVDSSENNYGFHTSLALDAYGYPHICYREAVGNIILDLKYARWTGSGWAIETVDYGEWHDAGWPESDTSLALDSNGYPHISYLCDAYLNLKYARWTGSEWSIETIDSVDRVGFYASLALDSRGYPHISYYDMTNGNLKYARWTGSEWSIETIDSGGDVGWYTSLALDSIDHPHISYYDYDNKDLKYARWLGTQWSINLVDSGGDVGWYTSLALDSSDHPHISYYDYDLSALKYAQWTGAQWSYDIVDSGDDVGEWTSLALDSSDHPHISYLDETNDALKYACWTGSEWSIDTIDSIGVFGSYSSLGLDSTDHPHIGYYDDTSEVLTYAFSPDEYFSDVEILPIECSGDDFYDSVRVAMDVDTTSSGTLTVTVYAWLNDAFDSEVSYDSSTWPITDRVTEYGENIFLYVPPGSVPRWYDVELYLYDADDNYEDSYTQAVYLYPPDSYPTIDSCNPSGTQQDSFELEDTIYVVGTGFEHSTSCAVSVVVDTTWTDGMAIPSRVAGTVTSITSNTGGDIEATAVWSSSLTLGMYDVVVDVNGNGVYDWGVDVLDDSDIQVTAGVEIIPEFPVAMLIPILAGLSVLALIVKKRLLLN